MSKNFPYTALKRKFIPKPAAFAETGFGSVVKGEDFTCRNLQLQDITDDWTTKNKSDVVKEEQYVEERGTG